MTRALAPASIALSARKDAALPSGVVLTTEQAAASSGGTVRPATPAERILRPQPPGGRAAGAFAVARTDELPRTVVAELPGGRVLGPQRAVITAHGDLVQDLSYYFGTTRARENPIFLHPFPGAARHIAGRLGVLATRGDANYYHFLMDVVPRLAVLDAAGVARPESWYVPQTASFQRELLDLVGLSGTRIDSDAVRHVRADVLVVPSPPSMTVINPRWVVDHLRRTLLREPHVAEPGRGIYVSRGAAANNRSVVNEADVIEQLSRRGFTYLDPGGMSVTQQIDEFARAELIVAPHGAALANLVFASPGSRVIELFPADSAVPDYWKLACGVPGLRYDYVLGTGGRKQVRPVGAEPAVRQRMLVSDIEVDVPELLARIDGRAPQRDVN